MQLLINTFQKIGSKLSKKTELNQSHSQCLLPFKVTLCSLFLRKHFIARADRHCKKWKNNVAVKVDPYPMCHKLFGTQPNEQNKSDQRGKSFEETNFDIKVFSSQIFPLFSTFASQMAWLRISYHVLPRLGISRVAPPWGTFVKTIYQSHFLIKLTHKNEFSRLMWWGPV